MVMAAQPIVDAFAANLPEGFHGRRIYLSPRGRTLNQRVVEELAGEEELALLCGHYEGVDQRALDAVIDEELSIGDYVLTGGELGALVVIDAVARLVPGVLGSDESSEDESFTTGPAGVPPVHPARRLPGREGAGGAAGRQPRGHRGLAAGAVAGADAGAPARAAGDRAADRRRPGADALRRARALDLPRPAPKKISNAPGLDLPCQRLEMRLADESRKSG